VDLKSRAVAWTRPVLSPTMTSMRRLALAGVIANTVIMSTGAAVRLSASGLGCPAWPQCSKADIVASKNAGQTLLNTWIEFGNRLLNFPLVIVAALIFVAAWRFRPGGPGTGRQRGLVRLAAAQPLGVVAQAVIGGILVLAKLNPALVSVHFLVSASVVAAAVVLHSTFRGDDPPTPPRDRGGATPPDPPRRGSPSCMRTSAGCWPGCPSRWSSACGCRARRGGRSGRAGSCWPRSAPRA
jgi:heme A synthase